MLGCLLRAGTSVAGLSLLRGLWGNSHGQASLTALRYGKPRMSSKLELLLVKTKFHDLEAGAVSII